MGDIRNIALRGICSNRGSKPSGNGVFWSKVVSARSVPYEEVSNSNILTLARLADGRKNRMSSIAIHTNHVGKVANVDYVLKSDQKRAILIHKG